MTMMKNDNIQNTKQLIILYFNNDEDYFSFNLIDQSSSPILFNWTYQAFTAKVVSMTRTTKVDGVLIEEYNDNDTNSIISLVRDKDTTKIDVRTYSFTEKGCLACYDTYKTSLFNSACKFTRFDLL